jgi:hypothetical protein
MLNYDESTRLAGGLEGKALQKKPNLAVVTLDRSIGVAESTLKRTTASRACWRLLLSSRDTPCPRRIERRRRSTKKGAHVVEEEG